MIIDRTHLRWGIGTAVASIGVTLLYLANNAPDTLQKWHIAIPLPSWMGPIPPLRENPGATPLGLIYGTVALLIFIFAAFLGWRRNHPTWPVGRIQIWLKAHIWLTLFTIPLVLFHCGFHGGGIMTQILMWLYALVMLSGIWGLALQHVIPKLMRERLPEEVIFEQIPFIRSQLVSQMESLRRELADQPEDLISPSTPLEGGTATLAPNPQIAVRAVVHFIDEEALPYLKTQEPRRFLLHEKPASDDQFRLLKLQVPPFIHDSLERLQALCNEKRRLDLQTTLHHWLHGWIIVHAPASLLLLGLTIIHALVAAFIYA